MVRIFLLLVVESETLTLRGRRRTVRIVKPIVKPYLTCFAYGLVLLVFGLNKDWAILGLMD